MATQSTPKTASARLLTMKFMQRGAASASSSPATSQSSDTHASKRRRTTEDGAAVATSVPSTPLAKVTDQAAVVRALKEEEDRLELANARRAAELGDAHWTLDAPAHAAKEGSAPAFSVVSVGYAQLDVTEAATISGLSGQRRFGQKRKADNEEEGTSDSSDNSSDSSSESDVDSGTSPAPKASSEARREARRQRSAEKHKKSKELANERRKKQVKLNTLSSISGAGSNPDAFIKCNKCGKQGHRMRNCQEANG